MKEKQSPTEEFYGLLQKAYDVFNSKLFDGSLTNCILTLQREKRCMGYFSPERWVNADGKITHEIALNPTYFASHTVIEVFQTLVHEQCHLWQHQHGKPSRRTYHNREWADKMESIGLMPSHNGSPGGNKTGQRMSDYPIEGGRFLAVVRDLTQSGVSIPWFDTQAREESSQVRDNNELTISEDPVLNTPLGELIPVNDDEPIFAVAAKAPSKIKYSCSCNNNVWGKPGLSLVCGICHKEYLEQDV